jgi:tungstate transport system ATP-binding protein
MGKEAAVMPLDATARSGRHPPSPADAAAPDSAKVEESAARTEGILPLCVRGLRYEANGAALVDGVDFKLEEASATTVLIGPNGAGKSLTLRLLHGLLPPSGGSVLWNGEPPHRAVRLRQAMVFQKPVLLRRSAAANIDHALRAHALPRRARAERIAEVLTAAGLSHLHGRAARVLSGGEQQRLAIARAWAVRPEVLLLDEPTANLDPAATRAVEDMIEEIRGQGTKILLATHDMGQARRLGDEVLFLHRGRLQERTDAARFFQAPESEAGEAYLAGRLLV